MIALAVLTVTGVTFGAAPVAAQADDPALGDVFNDDTSALEWAGAAWSGVGGAADRAGYAAAETASSAIESYAPSFVQDLAPVAGSSSDAETEAAAVTSYYNSNSDSIESWVNERKNVSSNRTIEVNWHLDGETATRYVLVNASNGSIDSSRMVDNTSRTAGETVDICGYAADKSQEELETFVTEYAEPNEDVDPSYLGRMKGAYGDDVDTTLIQSGGDCPRGGS